MPFVQELRRSPALVVTVALTAVALGLTYGYDISNIAGALLFVGDDLGLGESQLASLATAVVVGQIVGALLGGPLADRIGRRSTMLMIAAGYTVFAVAAGLAPGYGLLLACRFLLGITVGLSITVVPVFVAESSPTKVRGGLLVGYQVTCVIGIIIGYLAAWALAASESWRWMLALAAVPAIVVLLLLWRVPETGHWYLLKGRREEARRVLLALEPNSDVDRDIDAITAELAQESGRLADMFRGPLLRASLFVLGLGFFIQITGINATIYYSPMIFEQMGFSGYPALLGLPAVVQFCSLIAVIVSMFIIDNVGRRPILLIGIGTMIVANAVLVITFLMASGLGGAAGVVGLLAIIVFTMGYTFGFGALVWVYAGETFPAKYRALGASLMLTADLVANAIVAQFFPALLGAVGGAGVFAIFGVLAVLAFVFVWRLAPETKGRNLDEISHYWANGARWESPDGVTHQAH